ncbi:MAG TPA: hypothetical protein VF765_11590 [Polyangiaceae bacterium]
MAESAVSRRDVALAATRLASQAGQRVIWTLVLSGGFYAMCLVVALQDLAYVLSVGGVPSVERAQEMNDRAGWLGNVGWLAFFLGTMFLTRWYRMTARAAAVTGASLRDVRKGVPFLRPYEMLRGLDEAVEPDRVPEPPPQPETSEHAGGYREPAARRQARGEIGRAPLLAWWLSWLVSLGIFVYRWLSVATWTSAKTLDAAADVANVAVACLGCVIVVRIGGRLAERTRRAFPG